MRSKIMTVACCARAEPPHIEVSRRTSFWISVGVVGHTLWTSAVPAMTYPLYAEAWHLSHVTITAIFAIYPIVVVAVLVGFGGISDYFGRRATMLLGLAASLVGIFLFAVAPDVVWLFAGRAFMGIGVGLTAGPSTAAVLEFGGTGESKFANAVTTAAQAIGFASALLIGGALVQYAPFPTRLNFWLLFAGTWLLPRHVSDEAPGRWRPKLPYIPARLRWTFAVASIAVTTAYTHGVLILSLGAQVARDLVGSNNAFVNGAALSLFAVLSGITGILAKSIDARRAIRAGAAASALSMALLSIAVGRHELSVFLASTATAGIGYSLLFLGGLNVIGPAAPAAHRGEVLSALYLFAYLSLGLVALALGEVATLWGLAFAINLGAATIAFLSIAAIAIVQAAKLSGPDHRSDE
jgi:MFS family permease